MDSEESNHSMMFFGLSSPPCAFPSSTNINAVLFLFSKNKRATPLDK